MARILIITDAWYPQVNGVVRTLDTTARTLRKFGHTVEVIEPSTHAKIPVPFYPEIRLALPWPHSLRARLLRFRPDHIHIATEGTLGTLTRWHCMSIGWRFTTSYHTKFPEYMARLMSFPADWTYRLLRRFHNRGAQMMVATPSLEADLRSAGFTVPIARWSRGVDPVIFRPMAKTETANPRPVMLYVGRVSAEKGVEDFLKLRTPGTKLIVGDGPARADLERRYPDAKFLGYRDGEALTACYSAADLFVFPSQTDTFGLVVVEALACGVPVAAYPATGPKDILSHDGLGAIDADLGRAVERALQTGNRDACLAEAKKYTWEACTRQFESNLVTV